MAPLALALALAVAAPAASPDNPSATAGAEATHASSAVATVFNEPYADAGDAFQVCCAAAACTFIGINECSLLTPEGKVLAMMSATVGGLGGFMGGVAAGVALWYAVDTNLPAGTPIDRYKGGDLLLTMALLSGAVGIVTGGVGGAAIALAADVLFLQGPPPPRRRGYYYSDEAAPESGPDEAPAVRAF